MPSLETSAIVPILSDIYISDTILPRHYLQPCHGDCCKGAEGSKAM